MYNLTRPKGELDWQIKGIFGLFALVIISLVIALLIHVITAPQIASATVASLVFGIVSLPIILAVVPELAGLKSLVVRPAGIEIQVERIERQAAAADTKASTALENVVKFIFRSMPPGHYYNLRKIERKEGPSFGEFEANDGFKQLLRYLRDNGYIEVKGFIGHLPGVGKELNDYVTVTPLG